MALVQKSNPINEDYAIAVIQTHLYSNLLSLGVTNYESYERVYVINGSPEIYIGSNNYKEVYYDDRFYLTSFFVLGNNKRKVDEDVYEVDLSIVFQANLNELYPTVTHRADAELHRDINSALDGIPADFEIVEIVTGIDNVYSGFTFKNDQFLDDVSQSHLVRVNLTMQYIENCNPNDIIYPCASAVLEVNGEQIEVIGSGDTFALTVTLDGTPSGTYNEATETWEVESELCEPIRVTFDNYLIEETSVDLNIDCSTYLNMAILSNNADVNGNWLESGTNLGKPRFVYELDLGAELYYDGTQWQIDLPPPAGITILATAGNEAYPWLATWSGVTVKIGTIEDYCSNPCADATVTVNGDAFGTVASADFIDVPVEYVNGDVVPTTIVSGVVQVPNPTPFSPHQLEPTIWLEATTNRYILTSSRISTYAANYGSNPTQTTGAARPIPVTDGGNSVVDFDDSARYLNLNSTLSNVVNSTNNTGGFEVWTVIKLDSGRSGTPVYFGARTATKLYFQLFHGGSGRLRWFLGDTVGTDARALTVNSVFPTGQTEWVLCRLVHDEATTQMKIFVNGIEMTLDGTENGVTSALDFNNYNPSYNVYLNGVNNTNTLASATAGMYMGDFMAFNRLLTDDEVTNLTNYFI